MNRLLTILLLAAGTAYGQIDNPPTSVNIVDATATGRAVLTATNAAAAATAISLGATNNVTFSNITANGIIHAKDSTSSPATNSTLARGIQWTNLGGSGIAAIYGSYPGTPQIYLAVGATNALTDVATFRSTGMTVASNAVVGGTLAVSNTATFSTNVSIAGSLSVGSFTTTTPSTWALDAVQTNSSGATSFSLTLPDNGNVIRVTNAVPIRNIANGRLGAFYYLVNQSGSSFAIENTNGITVQGGKSLTLAPNEVATLVATGPTNVSVAARGDLTDVALGGTANTAPSQTASSGSSLMTRDLTDTRMVDYIMHAPNRFRNFTYAMASHISGTGTAVHAGPITEGRINVRIVNGSTNSFASVKVNRQGPWNGTEGSSGIDWSRPMSLAVMGSKNQITNNVTRAFLVFGASGGDNDLPTNGHWVALNWVNPTNAQVLVSSNGTVTTNATTITTSASPLGFGLWIDHKTNGTGDIYYAERNFATNAALQKPSSATVTYSNGPAVVSTNQTSLTFGLVGLSTNTGASFEIVGLNNAVFFAP